MPTLARALPIVLLASAALAGCAATPAAAPPPSAGSPVTGDNCGPSVTFDAAPERVITIKSTSTEMLLALGLGDRIVGTAFQDGPVPEEWAADAASLTSISDKVPAGSQVVEAARRASGPASAVVATRS